MNYAYYPRVEYINGGTKILRDTGYVMVLPDSFSPTKSYPLLMLVHGIGERNDGSRAALEYLVLQHEWGSIIPLDTQKAADVYNMILVAPNYAGDFNPSNANFVFDEISRNYLINQSKIGLTGFSLGGGAVLRYISSSQANADRLAIAVPVAPVAWYTPSIYVANSGLPVWFHVNTNDTNGPTNLGVTLAELKEINNSNPRIPAIYTAYNATGHGGQNQAWGQAVPKAPGGQGFTDAKVNIFDWLLMNTNTAHVPVPSGSSSTLTTTTTKSGDTGFLIAKAGNDIQTSTASLRVDGSSSIGYKSAQWSVKEVPAGVNPYTPILGSGGWVTSNVSLPAEGTYVFNLRVFSETNYSGTYSEDQLKVVYSKGTTTSTTTTTSSTLPKVVLSKTYVPKINKTIYIFDDGTVEYRDA